MEKQNYLPIHFLGHWNRCRTSSAIGVAPLALANLDVQGTAIPSYAFSRWLKPDNLRFLGFLKLGTKVSIRDGFKVRKSQHTPTSFGGLRITYSETNPEGQKGCNVCQYKLGCVRVLRVLQGEGRFPKLHHSLTWLFAVSNVTCANLGAHLSE